MLKFKPTSSPSFEIVVVLRNDRGNSVGKKSFKTNDSSKLSYFWENNSGVPRKKRKRKARKGDAIPKGKEAEEILKEMYKDTENG